MPPGVHVPRGKLRRRGTAHAAAGTMSCSQAACLAPLPQPPPPTPHLLHGVVPGGEAGTHGVADLVVGHQHLAAAVGHGGALHACRQGRKKAQGPVAVNQLPPGT